jgi:peptidoglycan/LPS O-acetylase OafA/YrhL
MVPETRRRRLGPSLAHASDNPIRIGVARLSKAGAPPGAGIEGTRMNILRWFALKPESEELLHLDLMRFVAAMGILVLHSHSLLFPEALRSAVLARTVNLALFVDLFFVISGFVISYVNADRVRSFATFGTFMQRRIARLLPLHLVTMVVAVLVALAAIAVGATYNTMPSFSARCIVSTVFLIHEIVPCGGLSFNGVSWSISVEMALYILFPLLLLVTRRSAIVAWAITILAITVVALWGNDLADNWYVAYRPIRGLASFAFGMGLYHARGGLARLPGSRIGLLLSTVAMIAAMTTGAPLWLCVALVYSSALFAVAADMRGKVHRLVNLVAPLGQLTYSLYMIHWTVFAVLLVAIGEKILRLSTLPMLGLMIFAYACVFLLAFLSLRFLETPSRRAINRLALFGDRARREKRAAPGSGSGDANADDGTGIAETR